MVDIILTRGFEIVTLVDFLLNGFVVDDMVVSSLDAKIMSYNEF